MGPDGQAKNEAGADLRYQHRFRDRTIDKFLPKHRQDWSIIDLYRSRALVRTCFLGSLINPLALLLHNDELSSAQKIMLGGVLFIVPYLVALLYRMTGNLRLSCLSYLVYTSSATLAAQYSAGTIHAPYWYWIPFLIVFCTLMLGVKTGAIYTAIVGVLCFWVMQSQANTGNSLGTFAETSQLLASIAVHAVVIQLCFWLLMIAYDSIRNRTEVRAVMLRFTSDETDRLATVGERMGDMAVQLNEQLNQFQGQLLLLDGIAKRSDTKVEDLQKATRELQDRARHLRQLSNMLHKDKIELLEMVPEPSPGAEAKSA